MRTILLLMALMGPLLALPASAQTHWTREPLRIALEKLLSWNLGAEVTVEDLEGPLVPEVVLRGVKVTRHGEPLASIDRMSARVDLWALFEAQAPLISQIAIDGATLTLTRDPQGTWNLPDRSDGPETETSSDSRWINSIGIGELELRRGSLSLEGEDLDLQLGVEFEAHSVRLPWEAPSQIETRAHLEVVAHPSQWMDERIEAGRVEVNLSRAQLELREAQIQGSFGQVELTGRFDVAESFSHPAGRLEMHGSGLTWAGEGLGNGSAELATTQAGGVELKQARLEGGEVTVRARGNARRLPEGGLDIERLSIWIHDQPLEVSGLISSRRLTGVAIRARGVEAKAVGKLLSTPYALDGDLDADIELDGPLPRPTVEAKLNWRKPRVGDATLDRARLTASTGDERLTAHLDAFSNGTEVLNANATLPYSPKTPLSTGLIDDPTTHVAIRGEQIDLALLGPLLARYVRDLRGNARLSVDVRGASPEPQLEGSIELAEVWGRLGILGNRLGPIEGRIDLHQQTLSTDDLHIGVSEAHSGQAVVSGRIRIGAAGTSEVRLGLSLQQLPVALSNVLSSRVVGDMTIEGNLEAPVVRGTLSFEHARVRLPEQEDPVLREIRIVSQSGDGTPTTRIVERRKPTSLFTRSAIDLRLHAPRGTLVDGLGADVELNGDIQLTKAKGEPPRYSGEVEVVRGNYTFYGRRFAIQHGTARFPGTLKPIPQIDLEGTYRVADVTIHAYLTGDALDPTLRLDSDPAMPESEVLHYLVFGRGSDEPTDPDSSLDATAGALAAGVAINQITPLLEEALPIDELELQLSDGHTDTRIGVGKYLTRDVYVHYQRTLSREPVDEVRVELQLDDHWSLETQASSDENTGIDLIWSTRY
ncbi:translocation/assembly module TamB domain-containing protein [Myxococcota bacterium]|nr:translocation/assembly module TamB domain-containing protein [Myxococcota bacterium]